MNHLTASEWAIKWPYHWFGFWIPEGTANPDFPHASDLIDTKWKPDDLELLLEYLRKAVIALTSSFPKEPCPLCGQPVIAPSTFQSDGLWLWPMDLPHFVADHRVRLPEMFIQHIRISKYQPPQHLDIDPEQLPWPPR